MTNPGALVNKVWNYAHVLRDDGVGYGDYVEQITCLLFLKMDQERNDHLGEVSRIPAEWRWASLRDKEGDELELQYRHTLEALAREPGLLGTIFRKDRQPASETPWTKRLWIYDLRTNQSFTLKQRPLRREDLDDFVACYRPANRHARTESERFRAFPYDQLIARDKANLDVFWLKDESLEDADRLPAPSVLAAEIIENLEAALEQFRGVAAALAPKVASDS